MQEMLVLIDLLYESVLDVGKWSVFLEKATLHFDAHGAQIGHNDLVNSRLSFSMVHGYDWSPEHMRRYESLMSEDPRLKYFSSNPFKPIHCRMALTDAELHASRVYKEVLSIGAVEYSLGVNLVESDRALSYFLVLRDATQPRFTEVECEKMSVLIPHLARALRLERALDTLDFERQVVFSAIDSVALGVVIIDADGRIQFANKLAKDIDRRRDGISLSGGQLRFNGAENVNIFRHVRRSIQTSAKGSDGGSQVFKVERTSGAEAYPVIVSSLVTHRNRLSWKGPGDKLAVVFLRDPDHAPETRAELLQRLYGLTNSEARLTDLIALGKTLKQGAMDLGITEASARQYIKRVFKKTGVHGQPDLVRKVMNLPPELSRAEEKPS
ncbi:helix-turn-helix transcriptional regulator [Bradyrhizobium sp.]|uniref:helix-turn-helix transcriptional regulator n=1 Tax=Bradyrhizobium sp. TaxID=376 RepID=UPI003C7753EC